MNSRMTVPAALELSWTGVEPLDSEEMASIGGGGVILTGCLIAAGGAAVALIGVAVGIVVYVYLNE